MSGKILRLRIESYMGLNDVEIDWDNHSIMAIIADGGEGKTSLASFVRSALTGVIPEDAINVFTGKAKGTLDFEKDGKEYTTSISRTKLSEVVKIYYPDKTSAGKTVLQKMVGNVDINPFQFKTMDEDEQITWFKKTCKIDTRELDLERKEVYQSRTAVNNRIKDLRGYLREDEMSDLDLQTKIERLKEEKPIGDLATRRADAIRANEIIVKKQVSRDSLVENTTRLTRDVADIQEQIRQLQALEQAKLIEIGKTDQLVEEENSWLAENPLVDIEAINKEIDEINEFNQERLRFLNYMERFEEMKRAEGEALELTAKIEKMDQDKEKMIKEKIVRVQGMEILEPKADAEGKVTDPRKGVWFEGKPLRVLSYTEAIKFTILLRQAINGDSMPILILDDFERVGSQGRAELIKLCQEEGYSALVTQADPEQKELKVVITNHLNFAKKDPDQKEIYPKKKRPANPAAQN